MTVPSVVNRISYLGAGIVGPFAIPFYFLEADDLLVLKEEITSGAITTLVLTTDYSVTGAGVAGGGNLTLVAALSALYKVHIIRDPDRLQGTDYTPNDPFPSETHERIADKLTMLVQRVYDVLARCLKAPDTVATDQVISGANWLSRAGRILGFDSLGAMTTYPATATVYGVHLQSFVATAGQTVFNLGFQYVLGVNAVAVYVNGLRMVKDLDFSESAASSITFLYGLTFNDRVEIFGGQEITGNATILSSLVSWLRVATGAIARTLFDWLSDQPLNIKDFGARGDGVTNDTAAIQAAEAARIAGQTLFWPTGTYKISGAVAASKAGKWDMHGVTINSAAGQLLISTSDFTLEGSNSVLNYAAGSPAASLDRALRCTGARSADYSVSGASILVGATSFVAANGAEAATLNPGDWLVVIDADPTNYVQVEYKQCRSVAGTTINVTTPFAQTFGAYPMKWSKVTTPRQNVTVRGLTIITSDVVNDNIGVDAQVGVIDFMLEDCIFDIAKGLAWQIYDGHNARVLNNVVRRQVGRRAAISSVHGGRCSGNKFFQYPLLPTNGSLTVETGTCFVEFSGNQMYGMSGGAGHVFANFANYNTFTGNIIIGDAALAGIGIYFAGGVGNKSIGDTFINLAEGIRVYQDASVTPTRKSDKHLIVGPMVRSAGIGINISGVTNTTIIGLDYDGTVATPIQDTGTGTVVLSRDGLRLSNTVVAEANTLDWYTENTFVPTVTFATPGNLAVAYTRQMGRYTRIGNRIFFNIVVLTSSFTHTTAVGTFYIAGLPTAAANVALNEWHVATSFQGYTKANYTQVTGYVSPNDSRIGFNAGGSGQNSADLAVADVPTGGTLYIRCAGHYDVGP